MSAFFMLIQPEAPSGSGGGGATFTVSVADNSRSISVSSNRKTVTRYVSRIIIEPLRGLYEYLYGSLALRGVKT